MDNFTQLVDLTERWRALEQRERDARVAVDEHWRYPMPVPAYADVARLGPDAAAMLIEHATEYNRRAVEAAEAWRAVNLDQRLTLAELRNLLPLWPLPEADERGRFTPPVRYPPGFVGGPSPKVVVAGLDLPGVIARVKAHARAEARYIEASQRPAPMARDKIAAARASESARTEGAARVALIARARAVLGPADLEAFDAAVGFDGAAGGGQ